MTEPARGPERGTPSPLWQRMLGFEDLEAVLLLVVLVALLLALVAVALYYGVFLPSRRRRPLLQALDIIRRRAEEEYARAEALLSEALVAGLGRSDVAEARFALAWVRARLGRYAEASGALAELIDEGSPGREAVYLHLWLACRLKDHDKVERAYEKYHELLGGLLDTKLIVGITYLHRAQEAWAARAVDGAIHYFGELRRLGVLADEVPHDIDQHQVLLGMMALFERSIDEARKHFQGAVATAEQEGAPALSGRVGLLLCDWRASEVPDIDEKLGELAREVPGAEEAFREAPVPESFQASCPNCPATYKLKREVVGRKATCRECKQVFVVRPPAPPPPAAPAAKEEVTGGRLLLRNVLLWHAVSLLFRWRALPAGAGLPPDQLAQLRERLRRVRQADASHPDSYFIEGLVAYFFARDDGQRAEALQWLERATQAQVNVPEALDIVQRERKLAGRRRDGTRLLLELLRRYLEDNTVPEGLRLRLLEELSARPGLAVLKEVDLARGGEETAPTVEDIVNRGGLIHRRVKTVLQPRLVEDRAPAEEQEAVRGLLAALEAATKTMSQTAEGLVKAEMGLLHKAGEYLFNEEPRPDKKKKG